MGLPVETYRAIRQDADIQQFEIGERNYTSKKLEPVLEPIPDALHVSTLTGIIDYLNTNIDNLTPSQLVCHVESPKRVVIHSALEGNFAQRATYIIAETRTSPIEWGRFMDAERFNILLQSMFVDTPHKEKMLQYVGNIVDPNVTTVSDDGISQQITAKVGIANVDNVVLPNPVTLRPFRTFNEVEQPESKFIFRGKPGPEFALFEADNRAWELEAMKNIKAYIEQNAPGLHVIA